MRVGKSRSKPTHNFSFIYRDRELGILKWLAKHDKQWLEAWVQRWIAKAEAIKADYE